MELGQTKVKQQTLSTILLLRWVPRRLLRSNPRKRSPRRRRRRSTSYSAYDSMYDDQISIVKTFLEASPYVF
jgi:hypothetical protein